MVSNIFDPTYNGVRNIEDSFLSNGRWFGLAAIPDGELHRADLEVMTPFQMDAGNDTWGTWLQILGSTDTPNITDMRKYSINSLLLSDTEWDKFITRIQIAFGTSGAAAYSAEDYTEDMMVPQKDVKQMPCCFLNKQYPSGTKAWARCWVDGKDTGTVDFFFRIHEYDFV